MMRRDLLPRLAVTAALAVMMIGPPTSALAVEPTASPGAVPVRSGCVNVGMCRALGLTREADVAGPSAKRAAAAAPAGGASCDDGSGAFCGSVTVPLDYRHPNGKKLAIAWRLYRHTTAGAAISTTVFLEGGPGGSSIQWGPQDAEQVLGDSFAAHDMLFVDARGRGASGALDCEALQHGIGDFAAAVRACGRQLGDAVNFFGAASVARDLERVRASLSIAKLDLVGISYGSMESIAYATRFPSHVRSIVLASGATPAFTGFASEVTKSSVSGRRVQTDLCTRSTHCDEIGDPLAQLAAAAAALRKHPLTGSAPDPEGVIRAVTVTQNTLVRAARFDSTTLVSWVLPAVVAYRHGDPAALLRLGAAKDWEARPGDNGDPAEFSQATNAAEYCGDKTDRPWRNGLTEAQRAAAAQRFVAAMPQGPFFPWSGTAMVADPATSTVGALDYCLYWPDAPKVEPVLLPHAVYPDVPVLALVGDYDSLVDKTVTIADAKRFPRHQIVAMPAAGHLDAFFACPDSTRVFVDTLGSAPGCDPGWRWFLQPSFPRTTAGVPVTGLTRHPGDSTTAADRRVVAAAWRTLLDGWIQQSDRPAFTTSKGLRGGTIHDSFTDSEYDVDYTGYRFVSDLALSGLFRTRFDSGPSTGTFALSGACGNGSLTITAQMNLDRDGLVAITGTVNGHRVDITTSSI